MICSIGSDCCMRQRLNEFVSKDKIKENCFDWVLSDLNAFNYVLENYSDKTPIITKDKLHIITKTCDNKYAIKFKECNFISLHDVNSDLPEDDAKQIVCDKYNQSIKKLIRDIRNDEITFIGIFDKYNPIQSGNMTITTDMIERLFSNLNKYCSYNNHRLILILSDSNKISNKMKNSNRITIIHSYNYVQMQEYESDWYRYFLNWDKIFNDARLK